MRATTLFSTLLILSETSAFRQVSLNKHVGRKLSAKRQRKGGEGQEHHVKVLDPVLALQYATEPKDILARVFEYEGQLQAAHLSQALLRLGKGLTSVADDDLRKVIREDPRLASIVTAFLARSCTNPQHTADCLWACGLLGYNPEPKCLNALVTRLEEYATSGVLIPELATSSLWSLQRLGVSEMAGISLRKPLDALPFRYYPKSFDVSVDALREEVKFARDEIFLGGGKVIAESRLTAWQSSSNTPFDYSGKSMAPVPMTSTVAALRDKLREQTGTFYDGVLINLYEDGDVGMRFHQDPGQGDVWTEETAVISVGETRQFVMRDVKDHSLRHVYYVSSGDCVRMFGDCQEKFQHCVKVEKGRVREKYGARISLVYKQSIASRTSSIENTT